MPEKKILNDVEVRSLISNNDYSSAADYLFNSQLNSWQLLKNNYNALQNVQSKSFWFDGFKLKVQFNPERMRSTSAMVDESSIQKRKCFLCIEHLPEEQKGILLPGDFILLCNPYPILPQHFTVCSIKHEPQRLIKAFDEFLELTRLLSPKYSLIYNGPACGASAPDHLHFQAGTKNFIPIENDIQQLKNDFGKIIQEEEFITTSFIDDGLRKIIFIESTDKEKVEETVKVIFNLYEKLSGIKPEPLVNLICTYDFEFGWGVIIFLRSKHRPESFFKEDPEKLLISPAAIDLSGVVVTPREEDFIRTDKELLQKIFSEVSLDNKTFSLLTKKVKNEFR
ncbi:MAG TPA: DUF4922 domain-containing protein [Ignavibacteriaceae bacterium]|nr:DUF4922 domain-containing protein [Ignavibacteriaceae bacterium]